MREVCSAITACDSAVVADVIIDVGSTDGLPKVASACPGHGWVELVALAGPAHGPVE